MSELARWLRNYADALGPPECLTDVRNNLRAAADKLDVYEDPPMTMPYTRDQLDALPRLEPDHGTRQLVLVCDVAGPFLVILPDADYWHACGGLPPELVAKALANTGRCLRDDAFTGWFRFTESERAALRAATFEVPA